jgi:hypothetical protein
MQDCNIVEGQHYLSKLNGNEVRNILQFVCLQATRKEGEYNFLGGYCH